MNKENQPPDKERNNHHHHLKIQLTPKNLKLFMVGDSMIKKVDEYLLTSSLKHQYLVKTRPFPTAKTIDMYDYIKPTQRDFKPEIFIWNK